MGPDCGTAIINGIPLAFANVVKRGPIGAVGASGTGLQEVTVLVDRLGSGISQAIGTGGHDLSDEVGGISMLTGLQYLAEDPDTKVIVLISKPPSKEIAEAILGKARASGKPVVVIFLGADAKALTGGNIHGARTLEDAARAAVALAQGRKPEPPRRDRCAFRPESRRSRPARNSSAACSAAARSASRRPCCCRKSLEVHSNTQGRQVAAAQGHVEERRAYAGGSGRRRVHARSPASDDRLPPAHRAHRAGGARSGNRRAAARCRARLRLQRESGRRTRRRRSRPRARNRRRRPAARSSAWATSAAPTGDPQGSRRADARAAGRGHDPGRQQRAGRAPRARIVAAGGRRAA